MRRHSHAWACVSRHTSYMVNLEQRRNIIAPDWEPTSHMYLCATHQLEDWIVCRSQTCIEAGQVRPSRYRRAPLRPPVP